jgi:hypothetical protein
MDRLGIADGMLQTGVTVGTKALKVRMRVLVGESKQVPCALEIVLPLCCFLFWSQPSTLAVSMGSGVTLTGFKFWWLLSSCVTLYKLLNISKSNDFTYKIRLIIYITYYIVVSIK